VGGKQHLTVKKLAGLRTSLKIRTRDDGPCEHGNKPSGSITGGGGGGFF
jgi:hypothetical protein